MLDYKFKKNAIYLTACTYGPDSMALLDMLQKEGVRPVVVSINYHQFDDSSDDYVNLADYCRGKGLRYEYLDCSELPEDLRYHEGDDFKAWARTTRYRFFKEVYFRYKAAALFIAHHQDDLLETFLAQKARKASVANYGLSPVSTQDDMIIVRPLLNFTKQDLLEYDQENGVPFSFDQAAYEDSYTRNPIRREINALSEIDRENLLEEMRAMNDETIKLVNEFNTSIDEGEELDIRALIALPRDEFAATLIRFVSHADDDIALEPADFDRIRKFCLSPVVNATLLLKGETYLIKEYDILLIGKNYDELPYSYTLTKPGKLVTPNFDLDFSMGAEDRGIHEGDYPLTIRSAIPSDTYVVHGYLESVHSLYSQWKMPVRLRYVWPIFINKDGRVIYVPRYRTQFHEYHTSLLRMHVKEDEK